MDAQGSRGTSERKLDGLSNGQKPGLLRRLERKNLSERGYTMTPQPLQSNDPVDTLLRRQIKLFEHAHRAPIELKGLGISIKRQGIDKTKHYVNPNFLLLPLRECPYLSKLNAEQLSVLSALYFAQAYSEIATSETIALRYNMVASEMVFPLYSDPYMVLFHETAEEFDHIITFRSICQGLIGRGDVIGGENFPHLKTAPELFERYKGRLCSNGFASLYLLMRYMLNLALKQLEGFMASGIDESLIAPLAREVIAGHAEDEARHLTTSLELGLGLFRRATAKSRELIAGLVRLAIYSMIDRRFSIELASTWNFDAGCGVLMKALGRPEFADFPLNAETLRSFWAKNEIRIPSSPEFENSRRWLATQLHRLTEKMEMTVTPHGDAFHRYLEHVRATN
jgi:P-aminobenzoate N-oxygenase AurF